MGGNRRLSPGGRRCIAFESSVTCVAWPGGPCDWNWNVPGSRLPTNSALAASLPPFLCLGSCDQCRASEVSQRELSAAKDALRPSCAFGKGFVGGAGFFICQAIMGLWLLGASALGWRIRSLPPGLALLGVASAVIYLPYPFVGYPARTMVSTSQLRDPDALRRLGP